MTSDLIRLATELDECGGMHRLTSLINCAVKRCMEHERASWPPMLRAEPDDFETGVGMSDKVCDPWNANREHDLTLLSDKVAPAQAASRAPERDGLHGGPPGYPDMRGVSVGLEADLASIFHNTPTNPAPIRADRGERLPLPQSDCQDEHPRGITHAPDSPLLRCQDDFGRQRERMVPRRRPINPDDLGDGA